MLPPFPRAFSVTPRHNKHGNNNRGSEGFASAAGSHVGWWRELKKEARFSAGDRSRMTAKPSASISASKSGAKLSGWRPGERQRLLEFSKRAIIGKFSESAFRSVSRLPITYPLRNFPHKLSGEIVEITSDKRRGRSVFPQRRNGFRAPVPYRKWFVPNRNGAFFQYARQFRHACVQKRKTNPVEGRYPVACMGNWPSFESDAYLTRFPTHKNKIPNNRLNL